LAVVSAFVSEARAVRTRPASSPWSVANAYVEAGCTSQQRNFPDDQPRVLPKRQGRTLDGDDQTARAVVGVEVGLDTTP
jgi:hypothetical protein